MCGKDDQCASSSLTTEKPRAFGSTLPKCLITLEHFQSIQNHSDSHVAPLNFFLISILVFSPLQLCIHWYSSQISALVSL